MIAIALGANLGDPLATLVAVRPRLATTLQQWAIASWERDGARGLPPRLELRWSPLFRTAPVGGPPGQRDYLNAAVVAGGAPVGEALPLLLALQSLEAAFGRQRLERWGPRSLDLDLLWCREVRCDTAALALPHPRLQERAFVLAPLAAIDPGLRPAGEGTSVAELLRRLPPGQEPQRLPGRAGWPD